METSRAELQEKNKKFSEQVRSLIHVYVRCQISDVSDMGCVRYRVGQILDMSHVSYG
jgi:hypothetical protein